MKLKDFSNQKGITGIDVVIAITIISITTVAIALLYVNIVVGSKKVTRTAAATRIVTSMLENIDAMYYADVEAELDKISAYIDTTATTNSTSTKNEKIYKIPGGYSDSIFKTRIGSGYDLVLDVTEVTGSRVEDTSSYIKEPRDCPLVLEVKITINYKVSNITNKVTLKTIKKRELLDECNEPDVTLLLKEGYGVKSLNQITPIKWSTDSNSYIQTTKSNGWYSYSNKEWAKVLIKDYSDDATKAAFNLTTSEVKDIDNQKIYMWIPRYGKTTDGTAEVAFVYGTSNDRIKEFEFNINAANNTDTTLNGYFFKYNGVAKWDKTAKEVKKENLEVSNFQKSDTGVWVDISGGTFNSAGLQTIYSVLNGSTKYGPSTSHLGKIY